MLNNVRARGRLPGGLIANHHYRHPPNALHRMMKEFRGALFLLPIIGILIETSLVWVGMDAVSPSRA